MAQSNREANQNIYAGLISLIVDGFSGLRFRRRRLGALGERPVVKDPNGRCKVRGEREPDQIWRKQPAYRGVDLAPDIDEVGRQTSHDI